MAKGNTFVYREKKVKRRKGIHAKSKTSQLKGSKNYLKIYKGQGR
tara:strand:- start:1696 stop:1830 length:135 start_codon:yes stop_codon:yes gene_type:complete